MYTTIIHPLRKMYGLSINEYCILEAIRNLGNNVKYNGWCVLPISQLAIALDLSEDTVRRTYKKLEEASLVIRRWENRQDTAIRSCDEWNEWFMPEKAHLILGMKTNTNEISGYIPKPEHKNQNPESGSNLRGGVVAICEGGGSNLLPNTNKDINKDIYNNPPIVPPKGGKEEGFEIFWKAYPRKQGKGAARISWNKIKKSSVPLDIILKALEQQKKSDQWLKDGGQFIPHPSTWLNQERWEDEVSAPTVHQEITKDNILSFIN